MAAAPRTIAANLDGSGGGEPVHGAGIESAEITALIANEAAKPWVGRLDAPVAAWRAGQHADHSQLRLWQ